MDKLKTFRQNGCIYLLITYFIYAALFPSLRLLLLGSTPSSGFWEIFFSLSPDFLMVASFIFCIRQYGESMKWKNLNFADKALFVYLLVSLTWGFFRSQDILLSVQSIRLTYLPCIIYFIARVVSTGKDKKEWWRALEFIFTIQISLCCIGLVLFFFFPDVVTYMMKKGNYFESTYFFTRMTSILWNPIFFASVAAVASLYYLWKYLNTDKRLFLVGYFVCFASMVLTVSRGAFFSFAVIYLLIFIWMFHGWKLITFTMMSFTIYVLIIFIMTGGFDIINWQIKSTMDTVSMEGNLTRVRLWDLSTRDFLNNPWGNGLGKAGHVAHRYLAHSETQASIYSTDGWYLKLANEIGIPGIILFAVFMGGFIYTFFRTRKHTSFQKYCFAIFVFVMLQNIVSNVLDFNYFAPLFWLIIGSSFSTVPEDDIKSSG